MRNGVVLGGVQHPPCPHLHLCWGRVCGGPRHTPGGRAAPNPGRVPARTPAGVARGRVRLPSLLLAEPAGHYGDPATEPASAVYAARAPGRAAETVRCVGPPGPPKARRGSGTGHARRLLSRQLESEIEAPALWFLGGVSPASHCPRPLWAPNMTSPHERRGDGGVAGVPSLVSLLTKMLVRLDPAPPLGPH